MIHTIKCIFNIKASIGANKFLYYFQKIPFIGKLLRDNYYSEVEAKKVFTFIVMIGKYTISLLQKFLYLAIVVYLPIRLMTEALPTLNQTELFIHIMFFLSFIAASFSAVDVLDPKMIKYICVRLMGISPKYYVLSTLLLKYVSFFIFYTPALIMFSILLGAPFWWGIILSITITSFRLFIVSLHLYFFDKAGIVLNKNYYISLPGALIPLALAYCPAILGKTLINSTFLISFPFVLISIGLGLIGINYISSYNKYKDAVELATKLDNPIYNTKRIMSESRFADVKMKDKDFTQDVLSSTNFSNETGYNYLNKIFFARHKRLLYKPVVMRIVVICAAIVAGIITRIVSQDATIDAANYLIKSLPVFVFIMYFCSSGEKLNRAMFYNCDISLLRYAFYRNKSIILLNFKIRLKEVVSINLLPAIFIDAGIVLMILISGIEYDFIQLVILLLSILCLSIFFSVHHLFMYYIFQPFTIELNIKNPFYHIVNAIVYMICYVCFQVETAPALFSIVLLIATISYIITALLLVSKFSYKTFRVK
jgi:hypothetical protein